MNNDAKGYEPIFGMFRAQEWSLQHVAELQELLDDRGITHVEDTRGRVWRILGRLNRKSVPVTSASSSVTRIPFRSVLTFGVMRDDE